MSDVYYNCKLKKNFRVIRVFSIRKDQAAFTKQREDYPSVFLDYRKTSFSMERSIP